MRGPLTFIIILAVCFVAGMVWNELEKEAEENRQNYWKWVDCVRNSDGSDSECEECDALYNPNGLPFDMADSSRLSDYK